jgi:hypothetical protein
MNVDRGQSELMPKTRARIGENAVVNNRADLVQDFQGASYGAEYIGVKISLAGTMAGTSRVGCDTSKWIPGSNLR